MSENEDAFDLFLSCFTQWRCGPLGVLGLDYVAVFEVAERMGIEVDEAMLRKLRILEYQCLFPDRAKDTGAGLGCRHPDACAMCGKKTCKGRIVDARQN